MKIGDFARLHARGGNDRLVHLIAGPMTMVGPHGVLVETFAVHLVDGPPAEFKNDSFIPSLPGFKTDILMVWLDDLELIEPKEEDSNHLHRPEDGQGWQIEDIFILTWPTRLRPVYRLLSAIPPNRVIVETPDVRVMEFLLNGTTEHTYSIEE